MADIERIYTIPLSRAYDYSRKSRGATAIKMIRAFAARHMKAEASEVYVSKGINELVWRRGIQKPPRKVKVRAVRKAEKVTLMLMDEKIEEAKAEKAPEKKESAPATPAAQKPAATPAQSPKPEKKAEAKPAAPHPAKKD